MGTPETTLTPKQTLFCQEYAVDLNGTQAAIRAGYSPRTAEQQASRLLSNVKVKAFLQKDTDERSERLEIRADEVLRELEAIAYAKIERDGVCKMNDKIRALELLGKHKKLFTDKVEQTVQHEDIKEIVAGMSPEEASQIYMQSMKRRNAH